MAQRHLRHFVKFAWHVIEPATPLRYGWHIDAMADHIEAVIDGHIENLVINVPPGHLKSIICSAMLTPWVWTHSPWWRALYFSYADTFVLRDAVKARNIINSEWYQQSFRPTWQLADDQDLKHYYKNTATGERFSSTLHGAGTGGRGHTVIVDDPMKVDDAFSKDKREFVKNWWDLTAFNRVANPKKAQRIIVMQRLHDDDLSGHVLRQGGWVHLCLPSEYEPAKKCFTSIGWSDPRSQHGEILAPGMHDNKSLASARRTLGTAGYNAQYRQSPEAAGGKMFRREWFGRWRWKHEDPIPGVDSTILDMADVHRIIFSLDSNFKEAKKNDRVALGVWAYAPPRKFLINLFWNWKGEPTGIIQTMAALVDFSNTYEGYAEALIEMAANGPAIVQLLKKKVRMHEVDALGSKEARAAATVPQVEHGEVYLPLNAEWVAPYLDEVCSFPGGSHDDTVDQQSQALLRLDPSLPIERLNALVRM